MRNELAGDIGLAAGKSQYDAYCKRILSNKEILAWILKYTVKEFINMEIREIKECIENDVQVSKVRVSPGKTNTQEPEKISGGPEEDKVPGEGEIYYDIRFSVYLPGQREKVKMLNTLFSTEIKAGEKIKTLEQIFHIPMERKIEKELNQMCNLSDYVLEVGLKKGMEQGIEQGMERGRLLQQIEAIQKKIRKGKSLEQTIDEMEAERSLIEPIYRAVQENPQSDAEKLADQIIGVEK